MFNASKNGQLVSSIYKDMKGTLFPTIAVHSQNEEYVHIHHFHFSFTGLTVFLSSIVEYNAMYLCFFIFVKLIRAVNCIKKFLVN